MVTSLHDGDYIPSIKHTQQHPRPHVQKLSPHSLLFKKQKEPYSSSGASSLQPKTSASTARRLLHKSGNYKHAADATPHRAAGVPGDAVLSLIRGRCVFKRYPGKQEGFLTTLRSKLVRRDMLNELAVKIGLDKLVLHSRTQRRSHSYLNATHSKPS